MMFLFLSTVAILGAQEQAALELVRTLSASEDLEGIYKRAANAFAIRMQPAIQAKLKRELTEDEKTKLVQYLYSTLKEILPIDGMENALVGIITANLTTDEIQDLNTFYQSPLGKKLLALQPVFKSELQKAAYGFVQKASEKENVERLRKELHDQFPEWFDRPLGT
jgi:hypothetical protein